MTSPADSFSTTYCAIDQCKAKPTASGYVLPLIDGPTRTLSRLESHLTRLHAKCVSHDAHQHVDEEMVIVKAGLIEVEVDGTVHTLSTGDLIVIASNDLHAIRNTSTEVAEYFVVRIDTAA